MRVETFPPQPIVSYFRAYPAWNPSRVITVLDCQGCAIAAYFKDAMGQYQKAKYGYE